MKTTKEMVLVAIDKLIPYINNARTHSTEQINKLRSSLREFGFINPVIIDADYNINKEDAEVKFNLKPHKVFLFDKETEVRITF